MNRLDVLQLKKKIEPHSKLPCGFQGDRKKVVQNTTLEYNIACVCVTTNNARMNKA